MVYEFDTTVQRSELMKKIKSKDSVAELLLRRALWKKGVRYRKHLKSLPGKPDIVISKLRLVIFVDGEFWHGYNWQGKKRRIKSNRTYWIPKIERNMIRDKHNNQELVSMGWQVLRFWESNVKRDLDTCLKLIAETMKRSQA